MNVGDIAIIKESINNKMSNVVPPMLSYKGLKCRITKVTANGYYIDIDNGAWFWNKYLLKKVSSYSRQVN